MGVNEISKRRSPFVGLLFSFCVLVSLTQCDAAYIMKVPYSIGVGALQGNSQKAMQSKRLHIVEGKPCMLELTEVIIGKTAYAQCKEGGQESINDILAGSYTQQGGIAIIRTKGGAKLKWFTQEEFAKVKPDTLFSVIVPSNDVSTQAKKQSKSKRRRGPTWLGSDSGVSFQKGNIVAMVKVPVELTPYPNVDSFKITATDKKGEVKDVSIELSDERGLAVRYAFASLDGDLEIKSSTAFQPYQVGDARGVAIYPVLSSSGRMGVKIQHNRNKKVPPQAMAVIIANPPVEFNKRFKKLTFKHGGKSLTFKEGVIFPAEFPSVSNANLPPRRSFMSKVRRFFKLRKPKAKQCETHSSSDDNVGASDAAADEVIDGREPSSTNPVVDSPRAAPAGEVSYIPQGKLPNAKVTADSSKVVTTVDKGHTSSPRSSHQRPLTVAQPGAASGSEQTIHDTATESAKEPPPKQPRTHEYIVIPQLPCPDFDTLKDTLPENIKPQLNDNIRREFEAGWKTFPRDYQDGLLGDFNSGDVEQQLLALDMVLAGLQST